MKRFFRAMLVLFTAVLLIITFVSCNKKDVIVPPMQSDTEETDIYDETHGVTDTESDKNDESDKVTDAGTDNFENPEVSTESDKNDDGVGDSGVSDKFPEGSTEEGKEENTNSGINSCDHNFDRVEHSGEGTRSFCTLCGIRKDMLEQCDHNLVSFDLSTGGKSEICVYCGSERKVTDKCDEDHIFYREVEPTYYDIGIESAHCDLCGYSAIRVIPPLNQGTYTCELTLQQYADGAAEALIEMAESIYGECRSKGLENLYNYPMGDLEVYENIKDFTLELVKDETTQYGKARKIYDWIVKNIVYDYEASMYNVAQVWETKKAVCSQYVQLAHDMLSAVDIMSSYTSGYSSDVPWDQNTSVSVPTVFQHVYDTGHAIVTCFVDGRILTMDPTWGVSDSEKYFDMENRALAEYFIPVELNMIKIIPENVDVRNYGAHMRFIGDHFISMSHGDIWNIGGWNMSVNNLSFGFVFSTDADRNNIVSNDAQYIGSAFRNCAIYDQNGFFFFYLPDGREVSYGSMREYVELQNGKYKKDIEIYLQDMFEIYGGCLYRRVSGGYQLESCSSGNAEIVIPTEINGMPVVSIAHKAFLENKNIKKLTVAEGVRTIGMSALSYTTLEELYLPSTLESMQWILESPIRILVVAEDNPYFKTVDNVMYSKDGTALVYYPAGKTDKEYSVSDKTQEIVNMQYNPYIEKLLLPQSVTRIQGMNFLYNLNSMNFSDGLTSIGQMLGNKLAEIVVPDGVRELYGCAFSSCGELKKVTLPANLEKIAADVFDGCFSLETIEISESNSAYRTVDGVLFSKDMTRLVIYPVNKPDSVYAIPEGVSEMSDFVFSGCCNLKELILPTSMKTLPMAALNTSSIEKVNLDYVEKLSGGTFSRCDGIDVLVLPSNILELGGQEFFKCSLSLVIENSQLITDAETFLRAEGVTVFLDYDGLTDKELSWIPYVAAVYEKSQWEYVNGIPTPK